MMRANRLSARRNPIACLRVGVFVALVITGLVLSTRPGGAVQNTITQPDAGGQYTSLKLDSSGFPVVAHYDPINEDLKVVHCGNADCSAGNTVTAPDPMTIAVVGVGHTSLALIGNTPVVTHYDSNPRDLKLVRCGNAACSSGNTVRTLDSGQTDNVGIYASVAINGSGNPVVAYYTEPFDILKVLVCGDATCNAYGDQNVDTTPITGLYTSLALDASGFAVVSYYDQSNADLKVVHCGDANCTSGNTITTVDGAPAEVGKHTSLALDTSGFPVVSYYDETNGDLKVVHCGDANCTSGNTIATPDATGTVGQYTSLALDGAGNPVVSYYNVTGTALKVLHCGDATCTAGNTITSPDSAGTVGQYASLAIDGAGNPVVSYYDATDGKLNVLHCVDANCSPKPPTPTPTSSPPPMPVGGLTELANVEVRSGGGGGVAVWISALGIATAIVVAVGVARRMKIGQRQS